MLKVFFGSYICFIVILFVPSIRNKEIYEDNYEDETEYDNSTEEYDIHGRNDQLISELRPVYPVNHYFSSGNYEYIYFFINKILVFYINTCLKNMVLCIHYIYNNNLQD